MAMRCVVNGCANDVARFILCNLHARRVDRNGTPHKMTAETRFFRHVTEDASGCWNYSPVDPDNGYAQFTVAHGTRRVGAHRWSYEHFITDIPDGLEIDHLCRNRACVNPWHLEPVPHRVNSLRGVGSSPTCVNGHPYDTSNTETHARGHRQCRTCRQNRERRFNSAPALALGGESHR